MPKVQQLITELFGKEPHKGVNPDEVVAFGAAIQAGVLSGEVNDVLLLDVAPLSLGIETLGEVTTVLIPRNTTIPTRKTQTFSTAADNQPQVEINVLQGEREMANDNRTLGKFSLVGIPSAPRGIPQIDVGFDIDANGILTVSAKDLGTGKEQKITVTSSSGLDEDEIGAMVDEAASHADEDRQNREKIDARNQLDSNVYSTEKLLNEHRDKIDATSVSDIEEALQNAKDVLSNDDTDTKTLSAAANKLETTSHAMAEAMYSAASASGDSADSGTTPDHDEEEVLEAEVVDDDNESS